MSAKIPQVAYIPSAIKARNKFDLSNDNITTSDFFRIKPSRIIECCPRESFKLSTETLIRMSPLAVPTFGRVNHYMRWFWVPARTLCRGWNEFISQTPFYDTNGGGTQLITKTPIFKNSDVVNLILHSATDATDPYFEHFAEIPGAGVTGDAVIATVGTGTPATWTSTPVKFTKSGRALIDTLQNLGYNINWSAADTTEFSALPLLAYMRVICDYYINPQYVNLAQRFFTNFDGENVFNHFIAQLPLFIQFFPGYSNYDPDYFVSAWDNPIAPNNTTFNPSILVEDITIPSYPRSSVSVGAQDTPIVDSDYGGGVQSSNVHNLSDYKFFR